MLADHTRAVTPNLNKSQSRKSEAASPNRRRSQRDLETLDLASLRRPR
jgi:hypothetical protein